MRQSLGLAFRAACLPAVAVCLLGAVDSPTSVCPRPAFVKANSYAVGWNTARPIAGDFNGDGKTDLVGMSYTGVSLLLGNGDGTLETPALPAPLSGGDLLAVGDFDHDGKLDVAVTNGDEVTVLLGNGDGTFQPGIATDIPGFPSANILVAADLDAVDGTDLVIVALNQPPIILLSTGDGKFTVSSAPEPSPTEGIGALAAADVNGDGRADLAVALANGDVAVLLGNGDGTFGEASVFSGTGGEYPIAMAAGDVTGDGHPDLVVTASDSVVRLTGRGDGTFDPPASFPSGTLPLSLELTDLDGDGRLDAVLASGVYYGVPVQTGATILLNDGAGRFREPRFYSVESSLTAFAVADFDADGFGDVAALGMDASVRILRGVAGGRLEAAPQLSFTGPVLGVGDFDGDGIVDVLAAGPPPSGFSEVDWFRGRGDGTFLESKRAGVLPPGTPVLVADFDGDGHLDFATYDDRLVIVSLGNGDGSFRQFPPITEPTSIFAMASGDWNGDGKPDLAISRSDATMVTGIVDAFLGNGDGTFRGPFAHPLATAPIPLTAADVNGDGKLDLLASLSSPGLSVLIGTGDGSFSDGPVLPVVGGVVAVGDFDADSKTDLAVSDPGTNLPLVSLFFGRGDGTFDPPVQLAQIAVVTGLAAADFDGDGHLDLATSGTSFVSFFRGLGNGHFRSPEVSGGLPYGSDLFLRPADFVSGGGVDLLVGSLEVIPANPPRAEVVAGPACAGRETLLRAATSGLGPVAYQWRKDSAALADGGGFSGTHSAILHIAPTGPANAGSYDVVATGACGTAMSGAFGLVVETPPSAPVISVAASVAPGTAEVAASVPDTPGHAFAWKIAGGTLLRGQGSAQVAFAPGSAGTVTTLRVRETTPGGCESPDVEAEVVVDFLDVPAGNLYHDAVVTMAREGITSGCGSGRYCPTDLVRRDQMAVFLLRGKHGGAYQPPPATGAVFSDVSIATPFARWIEQLGMEGVTGGCGLGSPPPYCPSDVVTRDQMAVFLLRSKHGSAFLPPAATGTVFADVHADTFLARWMEQMKTDGLSSGCGAGNYCPSGTVTRGEMAAFIKRTFAL